MDFFKNLTTANRRLSRLPGPVKAVAFIAIVGVVAGLYSLVSEGGCGGNDVGSMVEHLGRCDRAVVVGPEDLLDLPVVAGCELIRDEDHPEVVTALEGRDELALVRALRSAGAEQILVGVDETDPQLVPPPTLRHLLGTYRTLDRFHAIYLAQAAGLFEIVEPSRISDDAGAELVGIARRVLSGEEPPEADHVRSEVSRERDPRVSVAVALQGLSPIRRDSRSVNFNRRDLYIIRTRDSLYDATVAAAERIRDRWEPTGSLEREGALREAMSRLTVEVEVLYDRSPIELTRASSLNPTSYRRHLWNVVELGVHGLTGSLGDRRRWLLPSSAVYRARPDVNDFIGRLARNFDLNGDGRTTDADERAYPASESFEVDRFRTHHFREMEPRGLVRRLRRGFVPVTQEDITRDRVRESVRLAASWLIDNQRPDGLFAYKYYPDRDTFYREFHPDREEAHNIVRHGLAAYSMFMVAAEFEDEEAFESARSAMDVMLENTVVGPGWYADDGRREQLPEIHRRQCSDESGCQGYAECLEGYCRLPFGAPVPGEGQTHLVAPGSHWESHDGYRRPLDPLMMYVRWKDVGKMGSVAAVVMALTEMLADRPDLLEEYRPYLEGYWRFLRFMQKNDGSFNHYFTAPGDVRYYSTETTIYPGEILFALSRIHRLLGDEEIRQSFDAGLRYYTDWFRREVELENDDGTYDERRRNDLVAFVPWMTMAANDMHAQHAEQRYSDIGIDGSVWIAERYQYDPERTYYPAYMGSYYRVWWEQAAMHGIVYTEGTAAAFALARRIGNDEAAEKMRRATLLGDRFAVQQVIRPGIDDHFLPGARARIRARGCVRFSLTVADCRTDYTYHSLSALVQTLRYFTEEGDWEPPPTAGGSSE